MTTDGEETAVDRAERLLIESILADIYPPNTTLPGERPLSKTLEIARPALREALQRLNHDGWVEIQQGKPTRVRDYLRDGTLNILPGLFKAGRGSLPDLVPDLLEVWSLFTPIYTIAAIRRAPGLIVDQLDDCALVEEAPEAFASAMWELHRTLIDYSGNPIFGLIFNSFNEPYRLPAIYYFNNPDHRSAARKFWQVLSNVTRTGDTRRAARLMALFMQATLAFWQSGAADDLRKEMEANETEYE